MWTTSAQQVGLSLGIFIEVVWHVLAECVKGFAKLLAHCKNSARHSCGPKICKVEEEEHDEEEEKSACSSAGGGGGGGGGRRGRGVVVEEWWVVPSRRFHPEAALPS